jgi:beta-lactamase class A
MNFNPVQQHLETFDGSIGLYAVGLGGTHEMAVRADEQCVTASVFKVPVLVELYRQVDAGKVDPNHRMTVEERYRVDGTGVLQELTAGLELTVRDLAMLMIIVSDNVATDMLLDLVGIHHVNTMLSSLGLSKTLIRKNSKDLLYEVVGMDPTNPGHTYEENRRRIKRLELIPSAPGLSVGGSNVSTPREMGMLLVLLATEQLLSAGSTAEALHILSRQNYNEMIPAQLPIGTRVAHKTGTLTLPTGSVRTDAAIVYHPQCPYVLTCFTSDLPSVQRGVDQIAALSRAVYDSFSDGGR